MESDECMVGDSKKNHINDKGELLDIDEFYFDLLGQGTKTVIKRTRNEIIGMIPRKDKGDGL